FRGREIEFFISSTGNKAESGKDSEFGIDDWNASKTHYTIRKFMNETYRNAWNDKSAQPWIYIRLGEMYLNYAEAMSHLGDETTARLYINKIRERARGGKANVLPDITSTGDELLKKIQHERRIELAFEDHRFFDVRRWKIADVTENKPARKITIVRDDVTKKKSYTIEVLQERKFLPQHYLLPIPRSEILRNSSLTQNPNYN
ncbi:MAG: RagB/SusD family nutrient uptake outer membrane protein, partial [Massilibacteroides sp.]|nr:RagB/SusD family nutrient uptake outer membrane protein [Massilibacteroides sp.]